MAPPASTPSPRPIETKSETHDVIGHLAEVMDALVTTVEAETQLVRAGHLRDAGRLQQSKSDFAGLYVAEVQRLRTSRHLLAHAAPEALADLQRRHDRFRTLLQINLTVLATAHAVSEGIIRGVSGEIQRKTAPQTYGASGRANVPARNAVEPLAVSRSL